MLRVIVGNTYDIESVVLYSEDFGDVVSRKRRLSVWVNRQKRFVITPVTRENIKKMFGRKPHPMLHAHDLVDAPPEAIYATIKDMATKNCMPVPDYTTCTTEPGRCIEECCLTGCMQARLQTLTKIYKTLSAESHNASFWADLEQNMDFNTGGVKVGNLPCIITHGHVYSFNRRMLLTGLGSLEAQCVPVWHSGAGIPKCPFSAAFGEISDSRWKKCAGNAWHCPTMAAFMAFVWANTVPAASIVHSIREMQQSDDEEIIASSIIFVEDLQSRFCSMWRKSTRRSRRSSSQRIRSSSFEGSLWRQCHHQAVQVG